MTFLSSDSINRRRLLALAGAGLLSVTSVSTELTNEDILEIFEINLD